MGSDWIVGRLATGVEWTKLAHDWDWWRAVVSAVMNLRVLTQLVNNIIKTFKSLFY
jgi:hypothetical protein